MPRIVYLNGFPTNLSHQWLKRGRVQFPSIPKILIESIALLKLLFTIKINELMFLVKHFYLNIERLVHGLYRFLQFDSLPEEAVNINILIIYINRYRSSDLSLQV